MADVKLSETTLVYGDITNDNGLGGIDMNSMVLPNMGTPSVLTDSANKDYVDTQVSTVPFYNFTNVLTSSSALSSQEPTALNTPQLVSFGAEILSGDVQLQKNQPADPEGNQIVFTVDGVYSITAIFILARAGGAGNANVALQSCIDTVPIPNGLIMERLANNDTFITTVITISDLVINGAPKILEFMLARSSLPAPATNDGGLFEVDITSVLPTFTIRPCATIIVNRLY